MFTPCFSWVRGTCCPNCNCCPFVLFACLLALYLSVLWLLITLFDIFKLFLIPCTFSLNVKTAIKCVVQCMAYNLSLKQTYGLLVFFFYNVNIPMVNFPFICSNIPAAPAHGVYISQMIRYSRVCVFYQNFLGRVLLLTRKLLNQGFLLVKLKSSLRTFYGRHHDLVDRYGISVSQMTTNMFHLS